MAATYYFLPTRNLFGEDSVQEAGTLLKILGGEKAMIVTDANPRKATKEQIIGIFKAAY